MNGRIYIGSSNKVSRRVSNHISKLESRTSTGRLNRELQKDWEKFGREAFEFALLERLQSNVSQKKRWEREQYWMDQFPFKYNIGERADYCFGVKATPEKIKKLSDSHKGIKQSAASKVKRSVSMKKLVTPAFRKRVSKNSKQMWGKRSSEERAKILNLRTAEATALFFP